MKNQMKIQMIKMINNMMKISHQLTKLKNHMIVLQWNFNTWMMPSIIIKMMDKMMKEDSFKKLKINTKIKIIDNQLKISLL